MTDSTASATAGGPLLFVSYAHEDKELCRRLVLMLGLVLKARGYDVWWDQAMVAGTWSDQIERSLQRAVAGLLLVSEHSLTSRFVMEEELPTLLARGVVAPVYGRPCPWESVPAIAALQFLGSTEKALAEMDESRGELAAALSALAKQAPDFLGLRPVADEPVPSAGAEAAGRAQHRSDAAVVSEHLGALYGVPELPGGYFERTAQLDRLRSQLLAAGSGAVGLAGRVMFGLHGAGGIGKSVLAVAMARDPTVRRAFPDGVYWVVLGERPDPVAAQAALARLVGIEAGFRTVEDGRATLREALRDRRVLVVVDDAWSAADAEALLVTGPAGRVVLTTRHALVLDRVRADPVMVDRLALAEARRFLAQATGQPEQLPAEADRLIEAVGGVVLALALIGATIYHGTSWADALAEVRDAADAFSDESFANQFKGMQVAWGALDDHTRSRYRELAVFGEDVTVPAVTVARLWRHTAGLDRHDAERLCAELAQRNLLDFDDGVRFHDLQRAFLQLQTPDSALAHRQLLEAHAGVPATPERWSTLPDDEPYLWDHLIEHLVAAGDVTRLEEVLVDPVWLLRRYHLQGAHAPEGDLVRGLDALPTFRLGARVLHRLRQVSHLVGAVTALGDRALTFAHQVSDLVPIGALASLFPPVTLTPRRSLSTATDALERVVTGHAGGVWSVAWSPDGRRLASCGLDGTLRIWETDAAGRQVAALGGGQVGALRSVAWSPDGRRVASGGDDGTLRIWNTVASGAPPAELAGHEASVWSVAWSLDGRRLASAGSDATVRLWEPDGSDLPVEVLRGHRGSVWSVAWSPDGRRVASGGADRTVRGWAADAPAEPPALLGSHDGWAWSVAWSPDGGRVASGGDQTVLVWDPDTLGRPAARLSGHEGLVWAVAWSPDGRRLASGSSDGTVRVWDPGGSGDQVVLTGHDWHVWSVAWSPDGRRLASGSHDETVRVWEPDAGDRRPGAAAPLMRWVWAVAWSPDGRQLVTGAEDGAILVWDPDSSDTPPLALANVDGGVWAVAWSPDGRRLAAAGADRVVRVWDAFRDAAAVRLTGHAGLVRSVAWSPDSRRLATVADDGTVRVWDPEAAGRPAALLTRDGGEMRSRSVAWSPDGRRLASGCDDGTLRIWDPAVPRQRPAVWAGHQGRVESVAWSPDGRLVATGGLDGTVRVWDLEDAAQPMTVLAVRDDPVNAVAWSPDGRRLASGGEDCTVRLWEVASGVSVVALGLGSMVCSLAWRGERIAVGMTTTWAVLSLDASAATVGAGP